MEEQPCPFVNALLGGEHQCPNAQEVTRRSGPSVQCLNNEALQRCSTVYDGAKTAALPALGHDDDLLSMPHSAMVKIQFGTIAGLRALIGEEPAGVGPLIAAASERYNGADRIPFEALVASIEQYRLQRRRSRG